MGNHCSVHTDNDSIRLREYKAYPEHVAYSSNTSQAHQLRWYADTFCKWEQSINHQGVADFLVSYFGVETLMFMSDLLAFVELEFDFDYSTRVFQLVKSPTVVQSVSFFSLSVERKIIHSAAKMNSSHFLPITFLLKTAKIQGIGRMKTVVVSDPRDHHRHVSWQEQFDILPKGSPMLVPAHIHLNRFGRRVEKSSIFKAFCFSALRVNSLDALHESHIMIIYCSSGRMPCEVEAVLSYKIVPNGHLRILNNKVYFPCGYGNVKRQFSKSDSSNFKKFQSKHPYDECGMIKVIFITETKLSLAITLPFISSDHDMLNPCKDNQMETERAFRDLQQLKI